ncbi:MAG TPA: ABC transporter permease [Gemmatimonadaceae bacterium]|nr:ABC transporter permease [Gemmatimonadaceae bacterium]
MTERPFRRAFRLAPGGRRRLERELAEELAFHIEARIEQLVARGLAPDEARTEALRRFGSLPDARRQIRASAARTAHHVRAREGLGSLRRDLRHTLRSLRRSPGMVAVIVLTLAIGIGANAAVFGLVSAVLLRTPPYANPSRLVMLWQRLPEIGEGRFGASPPEYVDYRDRNRVFSELAGYINLDLDLTGEGTPERLQAARVTHTLFSTLGVKPFLGRAISAEEDRPGGAKVVVLSYGLWQRRFGGDANVLGRTLRLDEQPYTVVGVMPRGFQFPWQGTPVSDRAELWIPMAFTPAELQARAESYDVCMVARLARGVTLAQARQDISRIVREMRREHPDIYTGNLQTQATVEALVADASESARPLLLTLLGAVAFGLLIACANVANLLLTRGVARQHETAVRRALGASAGQVVRRALVEALVLAGSGAAAGLALAYGIVWIFRSLGPAQIPGLTQAHIDARVLAFTVFLALLTALFCGLAPALKSTRQDAQQALKQGGRQMGGGRERQRLRGALVVLEAASAMVLLVGAGLLIHSFIRVLLVPPGFAPHGVALVRTTFDRNRYPSDTTRRVAEHAIIERLAALPGVTAVGLTTHLPLADERRIGFRVQGGAPNEYHWAQNALVGDDYFRAMHIPLRRGRTFSAQDTPDAPATAVINETMARTYWANADPVGRVVIWGDRKLTIVVVGLYGVLSYSVAQRTSELGVRMALGAQPSTVSWLVVRSGLRLAGLGIGIGVVAAAGAGAAIARLLFGVVPLDPVTYVVAVAALISVSVLASYAPARRAGRLDPALALRAE